MRTSFANRQAEASLYCCGNLEDSDDAAGDQQEQDWIEKQQRDVEQQRFEGGAHQAASCSPLRHKPLHFGFNFDAESSPFEMDSIWKARSGGTGLSPLTHSLTVDGLTFNARAIALCVPKNLMALSISRMPVVRHTLHTTVKHALHNARQTLGMPTIAERLRKALAEKPGANQSSLASACGVSRATISDWISGKIKSISPPNLVAAADFLSVEIRWLAVGTGPKRRNESEPISDAARALVDSIVEASRAGTPDSVFVQLEKMLPVVADGAQRVVSSRDAGSRDKSSRTFGEVDREADHHQRTEEHKNAIGRKSSTRKRGSGG